MISPSDLWYGHAVLYDIRSSCHFVERIGRDLAKEKGKRKKNFAFLELLEERHCYVRKD